jgi:hypothetical protein
MSYPVFQARYTTGARIESLAIAAKAMMTPAESTRKITTMSNPKARWCAKAYESIEGRERISFPPSAALTRLHRESCRWSSASTSDVWTQAPGPDKTSPSGAFLCLTSSAETVIPAKAEVD